MQPRSLFRIRNTRPCGIQWRHAEPISASLLRVSIPSLANVCDLQAIGDPYKGSLEKNEESVAFLFNLLIK